MICKLVSLVILYWEGGGGGRTYPPAIAILICRLVSLVIWPSHGGRVWSVLAALNDMLWREGMAAISSGRNSL